jgi:hypothetical protein
MVDMDCDLSVVNEGEFREPPHRMICAVDRVPTRFFSLGVMDVASIGQTTRQPRRRERPEPDQEGLSRIRKV